MVRRLSFFDDSNASVWLDPIDLFLAVEVCEAFTEESKPLSILEVGVFKGAWILSLGKNVPEIERLVGIDPYPGGHEVLRHQLPVRVADFGFADKFTHYDSWEDMAEGETRDELPSRFHVIHVDGDHTFDGAARDLAHVDGWLKTSGVVIVDDFFNPYYPGIASATYKFLESRGFAMFALSRNKAYASRLDYHALWARRLRVALEASPLGFSVVEWRGLDEASVGAARALDESPEMLLCLDIDHRSELLPSARDRRIRGIAKDWLPPKIGTWIQARLASR